MGVHSVLVLVLTFVEMNLRLSDRSTAAVWVWDGEEKLWLGGSGTSTDA